MENFLYDTGLLDQVKEQLKKEGIETLELGGVLPNPRLSLVKEGIFLAKEEHADMVLAIGGGSVIDLQGIGWSSDGYRCMGLFYGNRSAQKVSAHRRDPYLPGNRK
mgnify:CR=1 FL=1